MDRSDKNMKRNRYMLNKRATPHPRKILITNQIYHHVLKAKLNSVSDSRPINLKKKKQLLNQLFAEKKIQPIKVRLRWFVKFNAGKSHGTIK